MGLSRRRAAAARTGQPQPAHRVVHDGCGDHAQAQYGEGERQGEPPPRVAEDEEGHVDAELRIVDVERRRVAPGKVVEDAGTRRAAGEEPDQDADDHGDHDESRLEQVAVALQDRAAAGRTQPRPEPEGDRGVGDHAGGHDQSEGREQADPGQQHLAEDGAVVEGSVPEPVGPDAGEDREDHHEGRDDDQGGQDRASSSADPHGAQLCTPLSVLLIGLAACAASCTRGNRLCSPNEASRVKAPVARSFCHVSVCARAAARPGTRSSAPSSSSGRDASRATPCRLPDRSTPTTTRIS